VTAPTPKSDFAEAAPLNRNTRARDAMAERARFRNWLAAWLVLPNLPYLPATVLGGPPRYPEIIICAAAGLAVRRLPYAIRLGVLVAMMGLMLASFIARMFNMNLTMVMSVAPLVAGINPFASPEYAIGAALQLLTLAGGCWLLRYRSDFTAGKWLFAGIGLALLAAGGDYARSRAAMGSYARFPSADAPFSSATGQANLLDLADGKTNIMLVMVEAMGEPRSPALRKRFDRIWMRPELARKYEVVRGSTQYYGSTTSGEVRELCHRWGNYPEITKNDPLCLPWVLARRGYQTTSVHAFHSAFFDRHRWYPLVGFQRSVFGEHLLKSGAHLCPNVFSGACDKDVPPLIAKALDGASKPQFVYWLTLNSHLPIVENRELGTKNCSRLGGRMDEDFPMVCRLFAVWEDTADALVRTVNRPDFPPTHILIVGDHMPPLTHQRSRLQFEPDRVPWILLRSKQASRSH
jgi:hypothetical protein